MSIRSRLSGATRAVAKALTPDSEEAAGTDILETLKKEHEEVKVLLSDLVAAETAAQRKALVQKIKAALIPHTKAEEKVVYDAVIALKSNDAKIDGHEGYLEHEWASKTLQRLGTFSNASSPQHKAAAKVLKELVEHHIEEEEKNVWADVKQNFSDEQRLRMNAAFETAKSRVRIT